ncbi:DUF418 domain-containing protein [Streptomyces celluloflavus]|uniref:DUF418 domain-containing protein n=1 Tax=Streptomyces celluloflavus TaxID=58344 RepID=UPI0036B7B848
MSQHTVTAAPPPEPTPAVVPDRGKAPLGRLVGVDLARGLAVFGMYAAHVGPDPDRGGGTGLLMELAHGRASALFALLAGFAVVLITGRRAPRTGRAGRQAVAKVIIRAVILLALGTALTLTDTPVQVILAFYGLYFLLVLPLYRLGAGQLTLIAAGGALVCPQVLYALERVFGNEVLRIPGEPAGLASLLFTGLISLLFAGTYPALTWLPLVLAGMAIARLDLAAAGVRIRLALTGAALALAGHGGSWLALRLFLGAATPAWWSDTADFPSAGTPGWLLVASPHSETTLSILGNAGVAITVLVACLAAMDALPRLRRLAGPVIAVGSMSLTAYVFHIVGIQLLGIEELPGSPLPVLLGFIASVTVFAAVWSRFFRRGPLEWLMSKATGTARHVR